MTGAGILGPRTRRSLMRASGGCHPVGVAGRSISRRTGQLDRLAVHGIRSLCMNMARCHEKALHCAWSCLSCMTVTLVVTFTVIVTASPTPIHNSMIESNGDTNRVTALKLSNSCPCARTRVLQREGSHPVGATVSHTLPLALPILLALFEDYHVVNPKP